MRTTATTWFATSAVALMVIALFTTNPFFLFFTFPLIVVLSIGLLLRPSKMKLRVQRSVSRDRLAVDQSVEITLKVENLGGKIELLEVEDRIPRGAEVKKGSNHWFAALGAGETVSRSYHFVPRAKGNYTVGPITVRSREPLGLHYEEDILSLQSLVVAAPRIEDIRQMKLVPRKTRITLGQVQSRQIGQGTEFWGVRQYQPGDDLRSINWKATARRDVLHTNEFEGERTADAVIVLDARAAADVGPQIVSTVELGVRAALALSERILHMQNRVGLVVQRDVIDWVYPAYGKHQLYKIVDHLINVRASGEWPFEHVVWVLSRFFPRNVQVIVISPLVDAKAQDTVRTLAGFGFDLLVISPSPLEVERAMYKDDEQIDVAYRILRLERDNVLAGLRQFATVVEWDGVGPLAAALKGVRPYPVRR